MMLVFAFFTLGYFTGVVTVLAVFPPKVKEIEMQEEDTASVIENSRQPDSSQIEHTPSKNLIFEI